MWQQLTQSLSKTMPMSLRPWLIESYILTQHLKKCGEWRLQVVQAWQWHDSQQAWQREIVHQLNQRSVVYAQVIVPEITYQRFKAEFGDLNDKPLGETLLYHNDAVTRSPFEYLCLTPEMDLYQKAFPLLREKQLWARRSMFYWQDLPLEVVEVFVQEMPMFQKPTIRIRLMSTVRHRLLDYIHLIRLHRPIPILLMLWPTLWGLWVASGGMPRWHYLWIFMAGVVIMRSAGDIFNDLADRKLDGFVERTQRRPLAVGRISVKAALVFALILCSLAFGLVWLLNPLCMVLAVVGLGLAVLYPFMKRLTHFPQVVLGLAYNWGIVMAFAAVQNSLPWQAWALLAIALVWTVAYDTMYALADVKDDVQLGVKSTAVLFGDAYAIWIGALQGVTVLGLLIFGYIQHYALWYFLCCVAGIPFFVYQHTLLSGHQIQRCIRAFNNNHWVGLLVLVGIGLAK